MSLAPGGQYHGRMLNFSDRLAKACRAKGSPLCVGLDPHLEHLPEVLTAAAKPTLPGLAKAVEAFSDGVLEAIAPVAAAVKVNIAFYERLGSPGMRAYAATLRRARRAGLLVVADVKRGDIGSTAQAYAEAHLGPVVFGGKRLKAFPADAVTLNAFLGEDAMAPFLARCAEGAGLYILVRTSNPGAADFQGRLEDPAALSFRVADRVKAWGERAMGRCGWSAVGAVVGATRGDEIRLLRARMPATPFLLPGIGAQGGSLADAAAAFDAKGLGGLVTASRSVIFAHREPGHMEGLEPARWSVAVGRAAAALATDLKAALGTPAA